MIKLHDMNGKTHAIAPQAIAQLVEASPNWHHVRTIVKLFDKTVIESTDTLNFIETQLADHH